MLPVWAMRSLELDVELDQLAVDVALLPLVVLLHVSLLLSGELTQGVDDLATVVLAVTDAVVGAHDGDVDLTGTCADVIPVDEVDVCELAQVQLAVLDGQGLASAEEHGAQVSVGVHGGEVAGLVNIAAELCVDGTGMTVVSLVCEVGDQVTHDVQQVVLQELQVEGVEVVGAFLDHDGAGGVVRDHCHGAVLDAGLLHHLVDINGDVVEGGDPAAGLELDLFLNHLKFHFVFLQYVKLKLLTRIMRDARPRPCGRRRSSRQPWRCGQQPWQHRKKSRWHRHLR